MIFASFGNAPASMTFYRMAQAINDLAEQSTERILVQTGNTDFCFKNVDTVKFLTHEDMINKMKEASIVLLQGGWGTISEAISLNKRIVSIPRRVGQECNHPQEEVVRYLEDCGCLLGCYDTKDLYKIIQKARTFKFKPLLRGDSTEIINFFINQTTTAK